MTAEWVGVLIAAFYTTATIVNVIYFYRASASSEKVLLRTEALKAQAEASKALVHGMNTAAEALTKASAANASAGFHAQK